MIRLAGLGKIRYNKLEVFVDLHEAIQHYKVLKKSDPKFNQRSFTDRLQRKLDDKVVKPLRDRMPLRREQMQRDRKHKFASLGGRAPVKRLSQWMRLS